MTPFLIEFIVLLHGQNIFFQESLSRVCNTLHRTELNKFASCNPDQHLQKLISNELVVRISLVINLFVVSSTEVRAKDSWIDRFVANLGYCAKFFEAFHAHCWGLSRVNASCNEDYSEPAEVLDNYITHTFLFVGFIDDFL